MARREGFCKGCGTALENRTRGCRRCNDRHGKWNRVAKANGEVKKEETPKVELPKRVFTPMPKVREMNADELFEQAMSGIKSCMGQNTNARRAELAVSEMHRRLKLDEKIEDAESKLDGMGKQTVRFE